MLDFPLDVTPYVTRLFNGSNGNDQGYTKKMIDIALGDQRWIYIHVASKNQMEKPSSVKIKTAPGRWCHRKAASPCFQ